MLLQALNYQVLMKWGIICFVIYDVVITRMGSSKWLIYCKQCRSNCYFCYFLNNPIVSLILLSLSLKCSWKSNLVSKIISWCLWIADWMSSVSWKLNHGSFDLLIFLEKVTFWACFLGSRLKLIFHWNVIFCLSSLDHHLNSLLVRWIG